MHGNRSNSQSGQALVIIIVGMVIALTIGLSIATQGIINLQTSSEEERSQRALSAAEAGIERALTNNQDISEVDIGNNSQIREVNIAPILQNALLLNDGVPVSRNDPVDIWLSNHPDFSSPRSGDFYVYWVTSTSTCDHAALEFILIHGVRNSPQVTRSAYDPCPQRRSGNGFSTPSFVSRNFSGTVLNYRVLFSLPSSSPGLLLRIVPLYENATIGITSGSLVPNGMSLPPQGTRIESTGESGDIQRKITVYRGYPKIPYEFFPNSIFSP